MATWKQQKNFQGPFVTVTHAEWNSSIDNMREKVWQLTQHNYENGSSMTQKDVIKWSVYLKTIEKCQKNSQKKSKNSQKESKKLLKRRKYRSRVST